MQTANQQNNSSLTPLSDPGSASSSSSTQIQQNCLNENIGQQHSLNYPPHQIQYLLANLLARNSAASNPNLAAIVANMQLTNLPPPPDLRLTPAFNLAALQLLLRNAAASNNQINTSGLLLRQHGNSANIVGYPQIKEENVSTGTDSLERHLHQQQILYGDKCEDEEKFLVDPSIVMEEDEEDEEEGQEEVNENIVKTQQEHQLENIKTTQQQTPVQQRRPRVGGSSAKTAEVWRFFSERPNGEKAATCSICQKTIKATNSRQI
uniref:BED-type domain-containing protein n=1 Tax=Meloidogyne hapla TaxID=6305 RepID=A0A1I8BUV5_MELHA